MKYPENRRTCQRLQDRRGNKPVTSWKNMAK